MNQDNFRYSSHGLGFENELQVKTRKNNFSQDNETQRQMDEVFERLFKYFTVLMILSVSLAAIRIKDTGFLIAYPIQWISALGMVMTVLMRRKISFQNRMVSFWVFGAIYGGVGIFTYGILGQGFLIMLFLCVLATLGGRSRHGYIIGCMTTFLTIMAGIAFHQGWFPISINPVSYVVSITPWVTATVTVLVLSIFAAMTLGKVKELWFENIKRLEDSEAKYRLLAENVSDMIWTLDLETMRFTYMSPSVQRMRGYTPEEAMALSLDKTLMPESHKKVLKILQEELSKEGNEGVDPERSRTLEMQSIRKDGTYIWIEATMNFIRDSEGRPVGILGVTRDISARKETEELLKESEEKYRLLIENIPSVTWITSEHGETTFISPSVKKIYGFSQKEIYENGDTIWFGRIHPDDRDNVRQSFNNLFTEGIKFDVEYRIQRKDEKWIWLHDMAIMTYEEDGVKYAYGIFSEITELMKAQEALRESEKRYRLLFNSSNDAVFVNQSSTEGIPGEFIEVNDVACDRYGYTREELLELTPLDLVIPEQKEYVSAQEKKILSERHIIFELVHRTKHGEEFPVEVSAHLFYLYGRPSILCMARDITDRKIAEEERLTLQAQLQQAQKMESIGTLAGGIAHDFNNILSPIMVYSEITMMDLAPDSKIHQNLRQIHKAGERARDLVKQILTFARRSEENRIPIKVSQILKEAIQFLRSTIPSTITIQYHCETEDDIVLADPTQMNQVVMNLCTNAAQAMREIGGILEVTLTDEYIGSDEINQLTSLAPGNYLNLSIRDTGPGISPDIMHKIFEPYFTTKGPGEGTGMGLAVSQGIMKSYGGEITVESELGKGTTFHVLLPTVKTELELTMEPKIQLQGGNERILLVDDEKEAVDAVKFMLERLGYKVTARTSSIEALEVFRYKPESFDFVITDQTMPNMTGRELVRELMSIRPDIPVVLCTGFSEQVDEVRAKEMGISGFLMKPILMTELANIIREILDKK